MNSKANNKKVLVSGIKPTGMLHIGNYFGAMRQNIDIANRDDYESYIFIADYHALTSMKGDRANKLRQSTFDIACAYLALGLDISRVALFKQSDVPEHTELAWVFNNVVTVPYLMRAHAYKDHEAKGSEVNVGLFDYPVLMAADILMYHADLVPVGKDQKQHIEYARDIAGYYNRAWGMIEYPDDKSGYHSDGKFRADYFHLPEALIVEDVATVIGVDGRKMSKSYDNVIPLFGTDEEIKKAVMSIVTDSARPEDKKDPDTNNIFNIHKLFLNKDEIKDIRAKFEKAGDKDENGETILYGYKEAKENLFNEIIKFITPKREKYDYYQSHPDEVYEILKRGGEQARAVAKETMEKVRKDTGLN